MKGKPSIMRRIAGEGPIGALLIIFGLNAVDELDRSAFAILAPEIRDEFQLGFTGLLTFIAFVVAFSLSLQVPIAALADRAPRVRLALIGATLWACFSFGTGLAAGVITLAVARSGSAIGKAVNDPTHNSLIADWFAPKDRPRAYAFHRAANAVGATLGPLLAGFTAYYWGWRTPFLLFAVPTLLVVVMGLKLREPVRGSHERRLAGGDALAVATEEAPPSISEAWRMCWKIESLRRIFAATPFLAASLIGFGTLAGLLYEEAYGLDERARGIVAAASEPGQLIGLIIGAQIASRVVERDPGRILRYLAVVSSVTAVLSGIFAVVPNLGVAIAANVLIALCLAIVGPGIIAALSLAIPPRARSVGFSMGSLWVLPGLLILPFIGWIADNWGIRAGMVMMVPVFFIGGLVIASGANVIGRDVEQVRKTALARSEVLQERRNGRVKLLLCQDLQVSYDGIQVLHDVNFEVEEGEIVALLGTNGSGKSTLLRAISGVVAADHGAVIFDGRDTTFAPPNEIARLGIIQMPGGAGVFPSLTVAENLEAAGWMRRGDQADLQSDQQQILQTFPELRDREESVAADLSGGQQQMLALSMTLLTRPRLLMIDELSLGLAPVVVERLLQMVRDIAASGVSIVLVEQSANLALDIADTAYFLERGRVRFRGPAEELRERADLLRAVFLAEPSSSATRVKPVTIDDEQVPVLEARSLTRHFGGIRAVDNVSFRVRPNEVVAFIGPNGAGKTTLFDLIGGSTPIDRGQVFLVGQDITGHASSVRARQGLGRSFQNARLFPTLTVKETLAVSLERWIRWGDPVTAALHLPMAYDSEQRIDHRVEEVIAQFGLDSFAHKLVAELSTGTRRIVDLACVAAHQPSVILLDEPSSGIAQSEVEALGGILLQMRQELNAALMVIEHDVTLVAEIADRVIALDGGRVIAEGTAQQVFDDDQVITAYLGHSEAALKRSGRSESDDMTT
jgi:branched-chain amino acid transport system ATP-binding protein